MIRLRGWDALAALALEPDPFEPSEALLCAACGHRLHEHAREWWPMRGARVGCRASLGARACGCQTLVIDDAAPAAGGAR